MLKYAVRDGSGESDTVVEFSLRVHREGQSIDLLAHEQDGTSWIVLTLGPNQGITRHSGLRARLGLTLDAAKKVKVDS